MKIGARLESFGLPFRAALAAAARLGVTGVEFDAVGDLHPAKLSDTGRRDVLHLLRSHGLEATALACPLRHGLTHPDNFEQRIEHLRRALSLSCELGAWKVVVDAGAIPEQNDEPRNRCLREVLVALGAHADRIGARLLLDTGVDAAEQVAAFLATLELGGLGVNFSPSNFLLYGHDPVANIQPMKALIRHVHANDAKGGASNRLAAAMPLGTGDVDWMAVVGSLAAADYRGWVVVHLAEPDASAVESGVKFLRRLI